MTCVSLAELRERDTLMFTAATSEPVASDRGAVMPFATKELVQRVWEVAQALPDDISEMSAVMSCHEPMATLTRLS